MFLSRCAQAQNLFVADIFNDCVYEITPSGMLSTFASGLAAPYGLAFDKAGNLFVGEFGYEGDGHIYKFTQSGVRSTFASGLTEVTGLAFDIAGDLLVTCESGSTVYRFTPDGVQSTFATGLDLPFGIATDRAGNVATSNSGGLIIKLTPSGGANGGIYGFSGPFGLVFDSAGNLFVADQTAGVIDKVTAYNAPFPHVSTFVSGLNYPTGLTMDSVGDLFVGNGGTITEVTPSGVKTTFTSGLSEPRQLAFQPLPSLWADWTNGAIQVNVSMPSPYYSTIVQASTNLMNWVNVYTNTPPYVFIDSATSMSSSRFYRLLVGP